MDSSESSMLMMNILSKSDLSLPLETLKKGIYSKLFKMNIIVNREVSIVKDLLTIEKYIAI